MARCDGLRQFGLEANENRGPRGNARGRQYGRSEIIASDAIFILVDKKIDAPGKRRADPHAGNRCAKNSEGSAPNCQSATFLQRLLEPRQVSARDGNTIIL